MHTLIKFPRMSAHNLNIFIEKINKDRIVWFSPHDNGTGRVLHMILVLTRALDCLRASVSGHFMSNQRRSY
jgi:hypothetical protein